MSPLPSSLSSRAWIVVPLMALGFLVWSTVLRVQRVTWVTHAVAGDVVIDPASPTGYAGGVRDLVVTEQNSDSYHWISQTQQMLANREWRVRHIDYENAPYGREVLTPSPYRWWLGLVAWADHAISGLPLGLAVEQASLWADPLLLLLLFIGAVLFTAWRFGILPASLVSLALATLFPFAAGFLPGAPDDKTLSRTCSLFSILVLLAGILPPRNAKLSVPRRKNAWFLAAGIVSGFGLWVSVPDQVPVILGIALGGILSAWAVPRKQETDITPACWLMWSLGGAGSSLGFYLLEYYPAHLGSWQLQAIHPLYSLFWLGLGAALASTTSWIRCGWKGWNRDTLTSVVFAIVALSILPVVMWKTKDPGFLAAEIWSFRLTRLPGGAEATSFLAWIVHDGFTPTVWAAILPILLVLPAVWLLRRPGITASSSRAALAFSVGPVVVVFIFSCAQLGRWMSLNAVLLALLIAVSFEMRSLVKRRLASAFGMGFLLLLLAPGIFQLLPPTGKPEDTPLNEFELSALIERDLSHWLAKHTIGNQSVVLAPPNETTAIYFYGGISGVGTMSWENQAGIRSAVRIFSATTPMEARALLGQRKVSHIVIPSWDRYLKEYVRLGIGQDDHSFLNDLRSWSLPSWLKPVPYQLPAVTGYEDQSVLVFELVEDQEESASLSRLAEYFLEMKQLDYAVAVAQSLQRFPADVGSWIARAQVAIAKKDEASLSEAIKILLSKLSNGSDRSLPWDQRVGLAVVLAQGRQMEPARVQVSRCLADLSEARLRSISTGSLYRLLRLAKLFKLEIRDEKSHSLALGLLPPDSRGEF